MQEINTTYKSQQNTKISDFSDKFIKRLQENRFTCNISYETKYGEVQQLFTTHFDSSNINVEFGFYHGCDNNWSSGHPSLVWSSLDSEEIKQMREGALDIEVKLLNYFEDRSNLSEDELLQEVNNLADLTMKMVKARELESQNNISAISNGYSSSLKYQQKPTVTDEERLKRLKKAINISSNKQEYAKITYETPTSLTVQIQPNKNHFTPAEATLTFKDGNLEVKFPEEVEKAFNLLPEYKKSFPSNDLEFAKLSIERYSNNNFTTKIFIENYEAFLQQKTEELLQAMQQYVNVARPNADKHEYADKGYKIKIESRKGNAEIEEKQIENQEKDLQNQDVINFIHKEIQKRDNEATINNNTITFSLKEDVYEGLLSQASPKVHHFKLSFVQNKGNLSFVLSKKGNNELYYEIQEYKTAQGGSDNSKPNNLILKKLLELESNNFHIFSDKSSFLKKQYITNIANFLDDIQENAGKLVLSDNVINDVIANEPQKQRSTDFTNIRKAFESESQTNNYLTNNIQRKEGRRDGKVKPLNRVWLPRDNSNTLAEPYEANIIPTTQNGQLNTQAALKEVVSQAPKIQTYPNNNGSGQGVANLLNKFELKDEKKPTSKNPQTPPKLINGDNTWIKTINETTNNTTKNQANSLQSDFQNNAQSSSKLQEALRVIKQVIQSNKSKLDVNTIKTKIQNTIDTVSNITTIADLTSTDALNNKVEEIISKSLQEDQKFKNLSNNIIPLERALVRFFLDIKNEFSLKEQLAKKLQELLHSKTYGAEKWNDLVKFLSSDKINEKTRSEIIQELTKFIKIALPNEAQGFQQACENVKQSIYTADTLKPTNVSVVETTVPHEIAFETIKEFNPEFPEFRNITSNVEESALTNYAIVSQPTILSANNVETQSIQNNKEEALSSLLNKAQPKQSYLFSETSSENLSTIEEENEKDDLSHSSSSSSSLTSRIEITHETRNYDTDDDADELKSNFDADDSSYSASSYRALPDKLGCSNVHINNPYAQQDRKYNANEVRGWQNKNTLQLHTLFINDDEVSNTSTSRFSTSLQSQPPQKTTLATGRLNKEDVRKTTEIAKKLNDFAQGKKNLTQWREFFGSQNKQSSEQVSYL